jgi:hypothetical protein
MAVDPLKPPSSQKTASQSGGKTLKGPVQCNGEEHGSLRVGVTPLTQIKNSLKF